MPTPRRLVARWIGWSPVPIWGTAPVERLRRSLARAGLWDAGPWTGRTPVEAGSVLLLLGDHVYDDALIAVLVASPAVVVVRGDGRAVAAHVSYDRAEELAAILAKGSEAPADLPCRRGRDVVDPAELRRRLRPGPLVMPVSSELKVAVENRLFDQASPAATDVVSRLAWPHPARTLARAATQLRLSPNQITGLSLALAALAALLFHAGWLAAGLLVAWSMSLVDAVDGKLARLTLSFSQVGAALGHGVALAHPPLWWLAWWAGGGGELAAMLVMVAGSMAVPALEGVFRWRMGFPPRHWRRFDAQFRLVAAGRNVLLLILSIGVLIGSPAMGFRWAAGWQVITLAVLAIRLAQAWRTPPRSWLDDQGWKPTATHPM